MIRQRAKRNALAQAGFTMIEVMLAVGILATMSALIWGSFSVSTKAKLRAENIADRYHQIRLAMNRMAREMSMAYLSKNDTLGAVIPRTMFVSKGETPIDDVMFSTLAHVRLRANAAESDQSLIRYYAARDVMESAQTNLMRRESRRLGGPRPGEQGPAYVMLENIKALKLEFFDTQNNQWRDRWNTRSVDGQPDRLPLKVRITLEIEDDKGKRMTFRTATRVHMQNPIWSSPK